MVLSLVGLSATCFTIIYAASTQLQHGAYDEGKRVNGFNVLFDDSDIEEDGNTGNITIYLFLFYIVAVNYV